jgi:hypothetical protein
MDNFLLDGAHRVIAEIIKGKQAVSNYDGVREKMGYVRGTTVNCAVCGKSFDTPEKLKAHVERKHNLVQT